MTDNFSTIYKNFLLNNLQLLRINDKQNLSHLSIENLSDIISGKAYSINDFFGDNIQFKNKNFGERSQDLMYKIPHKTKLLDIAQNYIGGIIEVTPNEYKHMSNKERQKTQAAVIGSNGGITEAWCAHMICFMCQKAGINIGEYKNSVQKFIDWANKQNYYRPIETKQYSLINFETEEASRTAQIKKQTKNMKEGDLIVWKSDSCHITQNGTQLGSSSHIGILESINDDGTISVIEGNANEFKKNDKYDRIIATNAKEAKNGDQSVGEPQELNPKDGLIRKVYTPQELASSGYSGYINMQKIVK